MITRKPKTIIVIAGPTAVGKTALAIQVAKNFQTGIISADSRQCYRELTIGTAKPNPAQLAAAHHDFINTHTITEEVHAGLFETLAMGYAADIFAHHPIAVMSGGTGLYIRAFCEGMDPMPEIPIPVREHLREMYQQHGLGWLQEELQRKDPDFFALAERQNPHRLLRALEIHEATGRSMLQFHSGEIKERDFNILKIGLSLPKELLWANILTRSRQMIQDGLEAEVRSLLPYRHLPALQTVGYTEMFNFLDGKISLKQTVDAIYLHTRQYAKRQMTWFRKDEAMHWFDGRHTDQILAFIQDYLS